eukprot:3280564-Amphidinium_carterae.1
MVSQHNNIGLFQHGLDVFHIGVGRKARAQLLHKLRKIQSAASELWLNAAIKRVGTDEARLMSLKGA